MLEAADSRAEEGERLMISIAISIIILIGRLVVGMPIPFAFGGAFLWITTRWGLIPIPCWPADIHRSILPFSWPFRCLFWRARSWRKAALGCPNRLGGAVCGPIQEWLGCGSHYLRGVRFHLRKRLGDTCRASEPSWSHA